MNRQSTRQQLQIAILRITRRTTNGQSLPNVDDIALRLSSRYPQSGMTIDEICAEIVSHIEKERDQNDCRN